MVVDQDEKVEGVVSLSDILAFLVLRPLGDDPREANTNILSSLSVEEQLLENNNNKKGNYFKAESSVD